MSHIPAVTLNNGVTIPQFGLGVWQAADGAEVEQAVIGALEHGYRLIDTAAIYGNEKGVGKAIKSSGVPREEIFLTTKLWNRDQGYESTLKAFEESLNKLGTDYVDLYLIHWPMPQAGKYIDTWKAFEKLYADERIRAIGVSNFKPSHLKDLMSKTDIIPTVNQIELHPRLTQLDTRKFCDTFDIKIESYSPIMHGGAILEEPTIKAIADKYSKTPAQVILRWHIQNDFIVIPKSVNLSRVKENVDIFDFELSVEDMLKIDAMNTDTRVGSDPDEFNVG